MLHSLASTARLNGQCGVIKSYDSTKLRYLVKVRAVYPCAPTVVQEETVAIKPTNLLQMSTDVRLRGLRSRPELNQQLCDIAGKGTDAGRYKAKICDTGEVLSVSWRNLVLPAGVKLFLPRRRTGDAVSMGSVLQLDQDTEQYLLQVRGKPEVQQWVHLERLSMLAPVESAALSKH
eukprot:TRINITY_DN430_c0_g1_i1.p3 TRINITY_DN430_c0_g1~~TRINITY_DN430_c0_g1_i1.p3  ORF type:complete len:176 (-),score=45.08 TRINITY_DN430_c0_g1_i1:97-624(-)